MKEEQQQTMTADQVLLRLEHRLNDLLSVCELLKKENAELRAEVAGMRKDHVELGKNRDSIRSKVEGILGRINKLENE